MNRVESFALWIGHGGEEVDLASIHEREIEAVVVLAVEEPPFACPRGLISCRIPLSDGGGNSPGHLNLAVNVVAALIETQTPTLVCCGAGMSRSPAVTAAALARVHGGSRAGWLERVAEHHPSDVSPALWADLIALEATPIP